MNGVYICVKRIFLSILTEGFENKGENILEGTSIVFLNKNTIKKKNGSRIYSLDNLYAVSANSTTQLNLNDFFVEENRFKYKGLDSEILNLKRNKEYLYGGKKIDKSSGLSVHRIFTKRFPEARFLELTNEEFTLFFGTNSYSVEECKRFKSNALKYLLDELSEVEYILGNKLGSNYPSSYNSHYEFGLFNKHKILKERKSLLISTPYDKLK